MAKGLSLKCSLITHQILMETEDGGFVRVPKRLLRATAIAYFSTDDQGIVVRVVKVDS